MTEIVALEKVGLNKSKYAEGEHVYYEILSKKQDKNDIEVVAMDCEMVGIYNNENMLARVSIVNSKGETIYDKFVKPTTKVTNYRTPVSGIRPKDIEHGEVFSKVKIEVQEILNKKLLVGHSLGNDFKVLEISHPKHMIRDTSTYAQFIELTKGQTPSLKLLALHFLGSSIQEGEHSSVQDALTALQLYMLVRNDWKSQLQNKNSAIVQKQEEKDDEVIAIFCEKVDILQGTMLARVSIVDSNGKTIYNKFVKPTEQVTNYRTLLSGIRPELLEYGEVFSKVKIEVQEILKNKLLIGHSLGNDFKVLEISHPKHMIRDTSTYAQFIQLAKGRKPNLKRLAFHYLETVLQHGKQRSVQNARAILRLYMLVRNDWESQLQKRKRSFGNKNRSCGGS